MNNNTKIAVTSHHEQQHKDCRHESPWTTTQRLPSRVIMKKQHKDCRHETPWTTTQRLSSQVTMNINTKTLSRFAMNNGLRQLGTKQDSSHESPWIQIWTTDKIPVTRRHQQRYDWSPSYMNKTKIVVTNRHEHGHDWSPSAMNKIRSPWFLSVISKGVKILSAIDNGTTISVIFQQRHHDLWHYDDTTISVCCGLTCILYLGCCLNMWWVSD